jgi:hypothetical protein
MIMKNNIKKIIRKSLNFVKRKLKYLIEKNLLKNFNNKIYFFNKIIMQK